MQTTLNETCPKELTKKKYGKLNSCWGNKCTRLCETYTQALEKELRSGRPEHNAETHTRKKDYDLKGKHAKEKKNIWRHK